MGLFDGVLGDVLGGLARGQGVAPLLANVALGILLRLFQQHGGVAGLLDALRRHGLGPQVDSWVGTGANQPLSAERLSAILGRGPLARVARRIGVEPHILAEYLARYLPELIDRLTPGGRLPDQAQLARELQRLLREGLGVLADKLRR